MLEAKKCVRCGNMYISDADVCGSCQAKDGVDLYKLKGFFVENGYDKVSQVELAARTGISNKNLSRFLNYDEFKGLCKDENIVAASNNIKEIEESV